MSDVLCPHCGTKNAYRATLGGNCTRCGKTLPAVLPRAVVYAVRTAFRPLLILALVAIVLYASPHLRREYHTYFRVQGR